MTSPDLSDQLAKLTDLRDSGALTGAEFEQAKARLLTGPTLAQPARPAALDLDTCPSCGKRLGPTWGTRCEFCKTSFRPELLAARAAARARAPRARGIRGWRKTTWAIIVWTAFFLWWGYSGLSAGPACTGPDAQYCQAGQVIGGGIAIVFIGFVWLLGFLALTALWFGTRPSS